MGNKIKSDNFLAIASLIIIGLSVVIYFKTNVWIAIVFAVLMLNGIGKAVAEHNANEANKSIIRNNTWQNHEK